MLSDLLVKVWCLISSKGGIIRILHFAMLQTPNVETMYKIKSDLHRFRRELILGPMEASSPTQSHYHSWTRKRPNLVLSVHLRLEPRLRLWLCPLPRLQGI